MTGVRNNDRILKNAGILFMKDNWKCRTRTATYIIKKRRSKQKALEVFTRQLALKYKRQEAYIKHLLFDPPDPCPQPFTRVLFVRGSQKRISTKITTSTQKGSKGS